MYITLSYSSLHFADAESCLKADYRPGASHRSHRRSEWARLPFIAPHQGLPNQAFFVHKIPTTESMDPTPPPSFGSSM